MTFNYRIAEEVNATGEISYSIKEFYYNDDREIENWTVNSFTPQFSCIAQLEEFLKSQSLEATLHESVMMGNVECSEPDLQLMMMALERSCVNIKELEDRFR